MTPQEAFIVGAQAWQCEAQLATHRNLCHECRDMVKFQNKTCLLGQTLLEAAETAKRRLIEVAKELGIETLTHLCREF